MRPLSFSQISLYQSCPLCYRLQYIDRLEAKAKGYFSFGKVMHLCAEHFFGVATPPPPALAELLQFYENSWDPAGYESAEQEASYKAYGREILAKFWQAHQTDFRLPLATERMFQVDIEGVALRGVIDRVDKLDSGGLAIVDYKTNKELFTADYLAKDLQLTLYQLAAGQMWPLPVEKLTLYHLRSNTPCHSPPRGPAQLEQARRLVQEVAENIVAEKFPATENQFCPCDFPEYCPYHRHKFVTSEPPPAQQGVLPGIAIVDTVEQYVSLQEQSKAIELQLEDLKKTIIDFCQGQGLNRVFGKEHAITFKVIQRAGFDENEVRALLEPAGLWPRVLSFDPSQLKQILSEGALPGELRCKLEGLNKIVSAYSQLRVKKLGDEE